MAAPRHDVAQRIRALWSARDPRHFHLRAGASDEAIAEFEARYGVRLPGDLRRYLATVDGMEPDETDEEVTSFWGLDRIKPAADVYPKDKACMALADARRYFVLCDVLMDCFWYAIRLSPRADDAHPVLQWGADTNRAVAKSFTEFAEAYVKDPGSLPGGLPGSSGSNPTE